MSYERINAYHIMWLFVMFDLPTNSKKERKDSATFRKNLEKDGFTMHQYSIYLRFCGSHESAEAHIKRVKALMPPAGHVSILMVTDKQYGNIVNLWGESEKDKEKKMPKLPLQLELF